MKTGVSIHIGLNYVDPNHYSGWNGKLNAAEYDAKDMLMIAKACGFNAQQLIREKATREAVMNEIKKASQVLKENDIFLITYSGHGGQVPDFNDDEDDGKDETWCLFDGQLIDDELADLWCTFQKGVRILAISDSCHSGTVTKSLYNKSIQKLIPDFLPKYMPDEMAASTYFNNQDFYDSIQKNIKNKTSDIQASVKLISGCQDNQSSFDGPFNGEFTGALKRVWNGGKFKEDYYQFNKKIASLLPPYQTPNYLNIGLNNPAFDDEKPFTIQIL